MTFLQQNGGRALQPGDVGIGVTPHLRGELQDAAGDGNFLITRRDAAHPVEQVALRLSPIHSPGAFAQPAEFEA